MWLDQRPVKRGFFFLIIWIFDEQEGRDGCDNTFPRVMYTLADLSYFSSSSTNGDGSSGRLSDCQSEKKRKHTHFLCTDDGANECFSNYFFLSSTPLVGKFPLTVFFGGGIRWILIYLCLIISPAVFSVSFESVHPRSRDCYLMFFPLLLAGFWFFPSLPVADFSLTLRLFVKNSLASLLIVYLLCASLLSNGWLIDAFIHSLDLTYSCGKGVKHFGGKKTHKQNPSEVPLTNICIWC